jgi:ABC-type phosphate/phosphonate transport system substrate-binding protein
MVHRLIVVAAAVIALPILASEPTGGVKIALMQSMIRDVSPQKFDAMAANFKAVIRDQSGLDGELVVVPTLDELYKQLKSGEVKLGAFHGFEFAWLKQQNADLIPFMLAVGDPDGMKSVVVVGKDNPAKSLADLRGQKLNMTASTPEHSRLFLHRLCRHDGKNLADLFAKVETPPSVEDALDDVVDGKVPAAVAERTGLKMFERRKPARFAKLRILAESPQFPASVLAYVRGQVGETTLDQFRTGMNNADKSEQGKHLMTQMKVKRFAAVPTDYVQQLEAISKQFPRYAGEN